MAQFRQSGSDRVTVRIHHDSPAVAADQWIPHRRPRRPPSKPSRGPSTAAVALSLTVLVLVSFFAFCRLSSLKDDVRRGVDDGGSGDSKSGSMFRSRAAYWKELRFGRGSGKAGGDSRYWDKDDRRRDDGYREEQDSPKEQSSRKDRILKSPDGYKDGIVVGYGVEDSTRPKETTETGEKSYNEDYMDYQPLDDEIDADHSDDEYDDGIDTQDERNEFHREDNKHTSEEEANDSVMEKDESLDEVEKESADTGGSGNQKKKAMKVSRTEKKGSAKRKGKRHKFSSTSCEIKFLNSTAQIIEPLESKKFARFSLQYTEAEERPDVLENWEPRFAGHQTMEEREKSFYAHDQQINCGFVKGPKGYPSTGFDIAEDDMKFMSSCHVAVSSCIFGNSDRLRTPFSKTITRFSRKNVCFIMFVDEETLNTLLSDGQKMDNMGFTGLWKIIVVKNLPYADMRRVGKIPKFLSHRLFPSARYSIWLDSKLRLQSDPYLILEYFLWRRGYEYAISNHYDRHCVWDEVAQNKKLNKYNHTIIDQQFQSYQSDGLKRFDSSDPNNLLPSYVPEGSFIVRAHTPMSNLFSCLWFNEVERFTPRDQLSFAYTFLKLRRTNPEKVFYLNMFKDCERRAMTKLFHHRTEERHNTTAE